MAHETKAQSEKAHAIMRAEQRYGIKLNRKSYMELVKTIQSGKARFLFKETNRLSHFMVTAEGQQCHAVYDRLRGRIVTFLPKDADEHKRDSQRLDTED